MAERILLGEQDRPDLGREARPQRREEGTEARLQIPLFRREQFTEEFDRQQLVRPFQSIRVDEVQGGDRRTDGPPFGAIHRFGDQCPDAPLEEVPQPGAELGHADRGEARLRQRQLPAPRDPDTAPGEHVREVTSGRRFHGVVQTAAPAGTPAIAAQLEARSG